MFKPEQVGKRTRYTYAKINEVIKMPHLLDIQRKSYEWFLESGLQNIFNDISPIKDNSGNLVLSFEGFSLSMILMSVKIVMLHTQHHFV